VWTRPVLNQSCLHYPLEDGSWSGHSADPKLRSRSKEDKDENIPPPGLSFLGSSIPGKAGFALPAIVGTLSDNADEIQPVRLPDGTLCLEFVYRSACSTTFGLTDRNEFMASCRQNYPEVDPSLFEGGNPGPPNPVSAIIKLCHPGLEPRGKGQAWLKPTSLEACERFDVELGMATGLKDMLLPDLEGPGRRFDPLSALGLRIGLSGEFCRQGITRVMNEQLGYDKSRKYVTEMVAASAALDSLNVQMDFRQLDAIFEQHSAPGVAGTSEILRNLLCEAFPRPPGAEYKLNRADVDSEEFLGNAEEFQNKVWVQKALHMLHQKLLPSCKLLPGEEAELPDLGEALEILLQTEGNAEVEIKVKEEQDVHKQICEGLALSVHTPLHVTFGDACIALGESFASSGIADGARLGVVVTRELSESEAETMAKQAADQEHERLQNYGLHKYLYLLRPRSPYRCERKDGFDHFLLDLLGWSVGLSSADRCLDG